MQLTGELSQVSQLTGQLSNTTLRGYSAYEIAVQNGFEGTQEEWLNMFATKDELAALRQELLELINSK